jgi:hypothetical protein
LFLRLAVVVVRYLVVVLERLRLHHHHLSRHFLYETLSPCLRSDSPLEEQLVM